MIPKFNVGNPEWPRMDGRVVTYRCDEEYGWRQTTHSDGRVEIHRAPLDIIDSVGSGWEPWSDEPTIDESRWEPVDQRLTDQTIGRNPCAEIDVGIRDRHRLLEECRKFIKEIATGFDCDEDGHKYGTHCRCCEAEKLLAKFPPEGGS